MLLIVGMATESLMHAISLLLAIKRERILSTQSIKGLLSCKLAWMPRPTMVNRFGIHHEHFQSVKALVDKLIDLHSVHRSHTVSLSWLKAAEGKQSKPRCKTISE